MATKTKKYKYSGLAIIDEVNNLKSKKVLDLGCGYNEFKGKITTPFALTDLTTKGQMYK